MKTITICGNLGGSPYYIEHDLALSGDCELLPLNAESLKKRNQLGIGTVNLQEFLAWMRLSSVEFSLDGAFIDINLLECEVAGYDESGNLSVLKTPPCKWARQTLLNQVNRTGIGKVTPIRVMLLEHAAHDFNLFREALDV